MRLSILIIALLMCVGSFVTDTALRPQVSVAVVVSAPVDEVWRAWTTAEGLRSFFAPDAGIDARPGGALTALFAGEEGSASEWRMPIIEVEAPKRLALEASMPIQFSGLRRAPMRIEIFLEPVDAGETLVRVLQTGFHIGTRWDEAYAFFSDAWSVVLTRLQYRFEHGYPVWPLAGMSASE